MNILLRTIAMHRRDVIKTLIASVFVAQLSSVTADEVGVAQALAEVRHSCGREPFRLVFEAEWNDIPCVDYPLTQEKWAAECIAPLINTQVDCLLYNLCSSDGYCCQLENGELLMSAFEKLPDAWIWRYRENTKRLIDSDANPPKLACQYGHRLGMLVIPVVRMNDRHDMIYPYEVSQFKRTKSHLLLGSSGRDFKPDWAASQSGLASLQGIDALTWGMFDYAHSEVCDHKQAIIEEFITRWDNDGVCLDFDRDPRLFKQDNSRENAALMTDMIRKTRASLNRVAKERGRPQYLYVRVLPEIDTCAARGMDVRTWVRERLVDVVAPGCGYMTFSLDLKPWLALVDGTDCRIVASNNHWKPTEETRAWAKLMRQRGAYGVQLFNYGHLLFGHRPDVDPKADRLGTCWFNELHPDYYRVLSELGNSCDYSFKNSRYVMESVPHALMAGEDGLAHRQFRGIDAIALPVDLTIGEHIIPFGFADDLATARALGLDPKVTLRALVSNAGNIAKYTISVNGHALSANAPPGANGQSSYSLPDDCIKLGENQLLVAVDKVHSGPSSKLEKVEIDVDYVDPLAASTTLLGSEHVAVDGVKLPGPLAVGQHACSFKLTPEVVESLASRPDAKLILRLLMNNYTYPDKFDVRLNGQLLPAESRHTRAVFIMDNQSNVDYRITAKMLRQGVNDVQFDVQLLNPQLSSTPQLNRIHLMVSDQ